EEQSVIETHTSNHNYEQATFDLFDGYNQHGYNQQSEVECQIRELNLSNMTPLEALIKLNALHRP
ncbi:DNA mismatch repair protein MutS, partial [human gut metagenome]